MSLTRNLFSKAHPLCALILGISAPAMAQSAPAVEVSGGYNLLHFSDETVPNGWYADVSGSVTPALAIVGQVTGNYKSTDVSGVNVDANIHTFMAGVRLNARAAGGVTPFAQALFGAARTGGSTEVAGLSVGDSVTDAALQLGGGVKFMPGNVGVQVGADYLRVFSEDEGTNVFRFAAGVVLGF